MVILLLRLAFVIPNKRRDKKYAEGDDRYNPNVTTYEDLSDWENLHFRYLCKSAMPSIITGADTQHDWLSFRAVALSSIFRNNKKRGVPGEKRVV